MGKVISFKDFELNKAIKMLADDYFDFIGFVYSLELYDSDRYKHTKIINIKYLEGYDKEVLAGECQAYYTMHAKYPKSYPLDHNWSIEFLPHFQNPKKIAKLSHKEKVETIKKEKYELLKIFKALYEIFTKCSARLKQESMEPYFFIKFCVSLNSNLERFLFLKIFSKNIFSSELAF